MGVARMDPVRLDSAAVVVLAACGGVACKGTP